MKKIRQQTGMSLVLVLIGISIISVILLAVFRLLDMSRDMAASFQNVIKAMDAMQEVRFAFADYATCTFNLQNIKPGPFDQPVALPNSLAYPTLNWIAYNLPAMNPTLGGRPTGRGPTPSPSQDPQAIITFGGLGAASISVDRITVSETQVPTPNIALINVEMTRKLGTPQKLRTRSIPVWIKQDAAERITCCSTRSLATCP